MKQDRKKLSLKLPSHSMSQGVGSKPPMVLRITQKMFLLLISFSLVAEPPLDAQAADAAATVNEAKNLSRAISKNIIIRDPNRHKLFTDWMVKAYPEDYQKLVEMNVWGTYGNLQQVEVSELFRKWLESPGVGDIVKLHAEKMYGKGWKPTDVSHREALEALRWETFMGWLHHADQKDEREKIHNNIMDRFANSDRELSKHLSEFDEYWQKNKLQVDAEFRHLKSLKIQQARQSIANANVKDTAHVHFKHFSAEMITFYAAIAGLEFYDALLSKDPTVVKAFLETMKDPTGHIGFYFFVRTAGLTRNALSPLLVNHPRASALLVGNLGMAAGMFASDTFSHFAPYLKEYLALNRISDPEVRRELKSKVRARIWSENFSNVEWWIDNGVGALTLVMAAVTSGKVNQLGKQGIQLIRNVNVGEKIAGIKNARLIQAAGRFHLAAQTNKGMKFYTAAASVVKLAFSAGKLVINRSSVGWVVMAFGKIIPIQVFLTAADVFSAPFIGHIAKRRGAHKLDLAMEAFEESFYGSKKEDLTYEAVLEAKDKAITELQKNWDSYRDAFLLDAQMENARFVDQLGRFDRKYLMMLDYYELFASARMDLTSPFFHSELLPAYYGKSSLETEQDFDESRGLSDNGESLMQDNRLVKNDLKKYLEGFFCGVPVEESIKESWTVLKLPVPGTRWSHRADPFRVVKAHGTCQGDLNQSLELEFEEFQIRQKKSCIRAVAVKKGAKTEAEIDKLIEKASVIKEGLNACEEMSYTSFPYFLNLKRVRTLRQLDVSFVDILDPLKEKILLDAAEIRYKMTEIYDKKVQKKMLDGFFGASGLRQGFLELTTWASSKIPWTSSPLYMAAGAETVKIERRNRSSHIQPSFFYHKGVLPSFGQEIEFWEEKLKEANIGDELKAKVEAHREYNNMAQEKAYQGVMLEALAKVFNIDAENSGNQGEGADCTTVLCKADILKKYGIKTLSDEEEELQRPIAFTEEELAVVAPYYLIEKALLKAQEAFKNAKRLLLFTLEKTTDRMIPIHLTLQSGMLSEERSASLLDDEFDSPEDFVVRTSGTRATGGHVDSDILAELKKANEETEETDTDEIQEN